MTKKKYTFINISKETRHLIKIGKNLKGKNYDDYLKEIVKSDLDTGADTLNKLVNKKDEKNKFMGF